jgi:hypothetical protein
MEARKPLTNGSHRSLRSCLAHGAEAYSDALNKMRLDFIGNKDWKPAAGLGAFYFYY